MDRELTPDEELVLQVRTHAKALLLPVVGLVLLGAGLGLAIAVLPASWHPWGLWVTLVVFVIAVIWVFLIPFLKWYTSTYALTTRRIMTRFGILTKRGHDLPLRRINNVNSERSLTDRMFGCGTLILETAAGQPLVLPDVPRVLEVQAAINSLLLHDEEDYVE